MAYALQFDGATVSANIPSIDLTGEFEISISFKTGSSVDTQMILGNNTQTTDWIGLFSSSLYIRIDSTLIGAIPVSINTLYNLTITRDAANLVSIDIGGAPVTATKAGTFSANVFGKNNSGLFYFGDIRGTTIITDTTGGDNRSYDWNQSSGSIVPESIAAKNGTIVGVPNWILLPVTEDIVLTDLTANSVIQRALLGANANVNVSGSYTEDAQTIVSVEARVILVSDLSVVVDWTVIDASPAGGTFNGNITTPNGGPYTVDVRWSNDTALNDSGVNEWLVGDNYIIAGQSNAWYWFNDSGATTPDAQIRVYKNGAWSLGSSFDKGAVAFANKRFAASGVPVGVCNSAHSGSSLLQVANTGGGYWIKTTNTRAPRYDEFLVDLALIGEIAGLVWGQGETDSRLPVSESDYTDTLNLLYSFFRADTGSAALPIATVYLGRFTTETDAGVQGIRDAQNTVINSDNNAYGVTAIDGPLRDTVHYADHTDYAERSSLVFSYLDGLISYYASPKAVNFTAVSDTVIDINIAHVGGSDFTPATLITDFDVLDDGVPVTLSAASRETSSTIRLTVAAPLVGDVTARYMYGANPVITGAVLDNSSEALALEATSLIEMASITPTDGEKKRKNRRQSQVYQYYLNKNWKNRFQG